MKWRPPRTARILADPVTHFQVLGERNSGTNFVSALLARNLSGVDAAEPYGWKHGFIDRRTAAAPGLLTVLVYRHPLRWLQSVHTRPLHLSRAVTGLRFSDFIRHDWRGGFQKSWGEESSTADMDPKARTNYPNPMRLRSAKIAYFEELAGMPARVAYVRFEDANRDPRATLAALAEAFDLRLRHFSPVATFKGETDRRYAPKRLPPVAPDDLAFIRAELDLTLEARIGYRLEDVPRFDGLPPWDRRSLRSLIRRPDGAGPRLRPRSGGSGRPGTG